MGDPTGKYLESWDNLDELTEPLHREGLVFFLFVGRPGHRVRTIASPSMDGETQGVLREALDAHLRRHPPVG